MTEPATSGQEEPYRSGGGDVLLGLQGAAAQLTLNRPQALNAITTAMRAAIADIIPRWSRDPQVYAILITSASERVFCAGGDVRELTDWGRTRREDARRSLAEEYALNWQLDCFTKPAIALMDGLVVGSGVGITLYGTHRVAGERYRFSMPETGIGLFPDVGVGWAFAQMPDEIGMYLALTGRVVGRADAYRLGLATHCIAAAHFGGIRAAIAGADPVDPLLDDLHVEPGPGDLEAWRAIIARCFSGDTVEEIVARLRQERGPAGAWADAVLQDLARRSPTSLKVTHRHLRLARGLDLRATLQQDFRLGCRFLEGRDLYEGVRALLVDRDQAPKWQPARLEDVTEAQVAAYFAPLETGELALQSRAEMQAVRV